MSDTVLEMKLQELPKAYMQEVYDFIDFLISRSKKTNHPKRIPGTLKGKIRMAPDFDDTPDWFKEYMP